MNEQGHSRQRKSRLQEQTEKRTEIHETTAEERLTWLEEANEFVRAFVSPEKRERWIKIKLRRE